MIQIAFISCAHIHTPGFIGAVKKRPDELRVKSVWDPNAARGQFRAKELGAQFVADVDTVLADPEIDAVAVLSETSRHPELVAAITKHQKHLFVEKPLGLGANDSAAMVESVHATRKLFQTGYFSRGEPVYRFLKEQIAKGTFGKITRVRGSNCHNGALGGWFDAKPDSAIGDWNWMTQPKLAGVGAFGDLGTHLLDIMIWMLGEVAEVTATLDNGTARYPDCDEVGEAMLRFKNGAIGTLAAGWDDVANTVPLIISGTEAHAALVDGKLHFTCKKLNADGKTPWTDLPAAQPAGFNAFLDAITGKKAELVTVEEAAYRSTVMEAMYKGAKERSWVAVKG